MRPVQSAVFLTLVLVGMMGLSGCAPRPASEESGDDLVVGTSDPQTAPGAEKTLASPTVTGKKKEEVLPFPHPAKLSESDIEQILSKKTPEEATLINLRFVSIALLLFDVIYDRYPTSEEGLAILLDPPVTPEGKKRDPIAREILLKDGWGNPIQYRLDTWEGDLPGFAVWSHGPDGKQGGDDIQPDFMDEIIKTAAMIEAGALDEMRSASDESTVGE